IWKGLIFFNLSSKSKWNIKNVFQYNDPLINKINIEDFVIGKIWKKIVLCNWKIYWENYSECLHCPNIHPELSKLVPVYQRRLVDIKDDHNWKKLKEDPNPKYQGGLNAGSETWSFDGSAQGHKINSIEKELHSKGQIYISTWPSMFLGVYGDHIRVVRILPLSNNKIELMAEWLFEKSTLKDSSYDISNVTGFAELVMTQDSDACELNQRGIYNLASSPGVLMPEEYIIKNFHDWLIKKIK
ncbi:hypothetical protein OAB63_04585, partial [Alphaproteobacteria bacterium]|nr:hypothetical protein [Alphaproteobacteria bacterium]